VSITNNPFASTRLNDTNIRVLRSTSVTQRVRDDLPLAVQYVKYDEEDFFAVGFNRILKTKIRGGYSEIFDFYNISVSGEGLALKSANFDTHYTFSQSALFAHVRDFLYRPDLNPETFVREGIWTEGISSTYMAEWPASQSGALTGLVNRDKPLWLRNHRDGTSAEVNETQLLPGPSGITPYVKIMALKPEFSRDEIQPSTFALNVLDTNVLPQQDYSDGDTIFAASPPKAMATDPSTKDTGVLFSHANAKVDAWSQYAGSGFTLEIVFRPSRINGKQSLLFKGGVLTTISGGMTALTQDIYDAGSTFTYAGAAALSGDNKFMQLSANPEGIFYESWAELSGATLFAGRHLEPQVDFLNNVMAPVFSELRVDLLSPTAFEVQIGDGDLRKVIGTTGLAYGRNGTASGGSGLRYAFAGASATYVSSPASGGVFDLEDGNVHHLIIAWSPTGQSHELTSVFPTTGNVAANKGSYSGEIRAYLDGKKIIPESSISSAQYTVSGLFMVPNDPTMGSMENKIPPVTFDAGSMHTINNFTLSSDPWRLLDSQHPANMMGWMFTDVAGEARATTACDESITAPTYQSIRLFDPLSGNISAQIVCPASTRPNDPALSANKRLYIEQVVTLSGGKQYSPADPFPVGEVRGSQFVRFEKPGLGFPVTTLDEITVEIFFRTNADRDGQEDSLNASRTGTIFSIGGKSRSGLYSPKQISLDYIRDTVTGDANADWPKVRVTLFDGDEQLSENEHELVNFNLNAYPVTSLSGSFLTDPLRKKSLNTWGFPAQFSPQQLLGGDKITDFFEPGVGPALPIYRSTPYLALSYSKNDEDCRLQSTTSLGGFYQLFVKQDIGLSAAEGLTTGDFDEGWANTLTSFESFSVVDSNTASQYYSSRSLNFELPMGDTYMAPRTNSPMYLNGIAESISAAIIGIANDEMCTFEVEEIRIWNKSLTRKEMQEHAKDRSTLYHIQPDYDAETAATASALHSDKPVKELTPDDLISQFTFNRINGPSSTILASTPQRSPHHGFTRRRDSMSFPRPNFDINGNNYSGEIFEVRGWIGALADPYDDLATTGNVMIAPGYEVYTVTEDINSGVTAQPFAATANEIGQCFARMGTVYKRGHIQRFSPYINNYLPLCTSSEFINFENTLTSCIFGNHSFGRTSRTPKTQSMLALWINFEDSTNPKLARNMAADSSLTFINQAAAWETGYVQYKDFGNKVINSSLVNHEIQRTARFGGRQFTVPGASYTTLEPVVGTIFNTSNLVVFDSSDMYQDGANSEVNFTDYTQSWDKLNEKVLSIQYNNVIYKAILQPNTIADGTLFNGSQNPTAYDPVTNAYFSMPPSSYITTIGFYNDENELLAVANVDSPLRKNEDQTISFQPILDFSPDSIMPSVIEELDESASTEGGGNI